MNTALARALAARRPAASPPVDCTSSLPTGSAAPASTVRVCVLSDTHGAHHAVQLPSGVDVLICCGDFTEDGRDDEVDDFLAWFASQPARRRILICGNHEVALTRAHGNDARALAERLSADEQEAIRSWLAQPTPVT